jgi:parallel beta helix pectate lyase-like protein
VSNMKVYNNVMAWNGTSGIIVWQSMNGVDIKNNIIYQNGHYGVGFYAATGSGVVINNNVVYANAYGNFDFSSGGSTCGYSQAANIQADPVMAKETATSLDAHLTSASPAIQAGLNLHSVFNTDMAGAARPSSGPWDLGAYLASNGAPLAPATLQITLLQGHVQVRWPTNCGNYLLQSRILSSPTNAWQDVTNAPVIDHGQYLVSYPVSGFGRFHRLRSQ